MANHPAQCSDRAGYEDDPAWKTERAAESNWAKPRPSSIEIAQIAQMGTAIVWPARYLGHVPQLLRRVQAVGLARARHGDITHAARRLGLLARSRGDGIEGLDLIAVGTRLSEAERFRTLSSDGPGLHDQSAGRNDRGLTHQCIGGSCGARGATGTRFRAGAVVGRSEGAELILRRIFCSAAFSLAMSLAICCCLAVRWSTLCRTAPRVIKIALISWEPEVVGGAIDEVLSGMVSAATVFSWDSEVAAGTVCEVVSGIVSTAAVFSSDSELVGGAIGEVFSGIVSAATVFSWGSEVVAGAIDDVISGVVCAATVSGGNQPSCGYELAIIFLVALP